MTLITNEIARCHTRTFDGEACKTSREGTTIKLAGHTTQALSGPEGSEYGCNFKSILKIFWTDRYKKIKTVLLRVQPAKRVAKDKVWSLRICSTNTSVQHVCSKDANIVYCLLHCKLCCACKVMNWTLLLFSDDIEKDEQYVLINR